MSAYLCNMQWVNVMYGRAAFLIKNLKLDLLAIVAEAPSVHTEEAMHHERLLLAETQLEVLNLQANTDLKAAFIDHRLIESLG